MLILLRWQRRPWLSMMSWWRRQKRWASWWRPTRCLERRRTRWSKNCSKPKLRYQLRFYKKNLAVVLNSIPCNIAVLRWYTLFCQIKWRIYSCFLYTCNHFTPRFTPLTWHCKLLHFLWFEVFLSEPHLVVSGAKAGVRHHATAAG